MPTPPNTHDELLEAVNAWRATGNSYKRGAESLGMNPHTFKHRVDKAKALGMHIDPAIQDSMSAVGTGLVPALVWAKTKNPDGTSYSTLLRPEKEAPEDVLDRIAERMSRVVPIPEIIRPQEIQSDGLNFVPLFDVHLGMRVGDFGTAKSVERLMQGFKDVVDRAPPAETLVIVNGGDFTEANDNNAVTPQSKHPLSVDMDFDDLSDVAVDVTIDLIEHGLRRSDKVIYQALKGNHDPATAVAIRQGLRQRYRDNPRFEMKDGLEIFTLRWESVFLAAIHGDQKTSKPEKLALAIQARFETEWAGAKLREIYRGHLHEEFSVSVAGAYVHQVNAICPPGRYANTNLFTGKSDIRCVTYEKGGGRKATSVHIFDD